MRPLRVLHVTWSGDLAGMLTDIVAAQKEDSDLNLQVCFGTRGRGFFYDKIEGMGVDVTHLGMKRKYELLSNISGGIRLHRLISKNNYDIIHFQEAMLPFPLLAAAVGKHQTKIIVHNRGEFNLHERPSQFLGLQMKKLVYKLMIGPFANRIIANSRFTADKTPLFNIHRKKLCFLHNAINLSSIEAIKKNKDKINRKLRAALALSEDKIIISVVARLVGVKKIDRFIRVVKHVAAENKRVVGLIVGNGPLMPSLIHLAKSLNCRDKIHFLGWRRDAKKIIAISNIFVLPSCGEAFGNAALEAVCLGIPVLVFRDGGGVTEIIDEGTNGYVVANEIEMVDKIFQIIMDETFRTAIVTNAPYYGAKYDIRNYVRKLKGIYYQLLADKGPHGSYTA